MIAVLLLTWARCFLDFISFSLLFSFLIFLNNILEQLPQQSFWEETFTVVFLKMFMLILCLIIGSFGGIKTDLQIPLCSVIWSLLIWRHVLITSFSLVLESSPWSSFHFCCCDKNILTKRSLEEKDFFQLTILGYSPWLYIQFKTQGSCQGIGNLKQWSQHPQTIAEKSECLLACACLIFSIHPVQFRTPWLENGATHRGIFPYQLTIPQWDSLPQWF